MTNKKKMLNLKNKGFSYGKIGKLFNLSRQRIHQIISEYGKLLDNSDYSEICQKIFKRDDNICQKCGEADLNLIVHHIDKNDSNNEFTNLITLCNNCHLDLHRPDKKGIFKKCLFCNKKFYVPQSLSYRIYCSKNCSKICRYLKRKKDSKNSPTKKCLKCKNILLKSNFHKEKRRIDGYAAICKKCALEYQKLYFREHKDKVYIYAKKYQQRHKKELAQKRRERYYKNIEQNRKRQRIISKRFYYKHKEEILAKLHKK